MTEFVGGTHKINNVTDEEVTAIAMMRMNQLEVKDEVNKNWKVGRLSIAFRWRSSTCLWGRFGGGWNWALGFEAGGASVILNLLICSLKFRWM